MFHQLNCPLPSRAHIQCSVLPSYPPSSYVARSHGGCVCLQDSVATSSGESVAVLDPNNDAAPLQCSVLPPAARLADQGLNSSDNDGRTRTVTQQPRRTSEQRLLGRAVSYTPMYGSGSGSFGHCRTSNRMRAINYRHHVTPRGNSVPFSAKHAPCDAVASR